MSQASTMPAAEFDLTREDSDLDMGRSIQADRPWFEPWVGGTSSSPFEVVATPPALPPPTPLREEDSAEEGDTDTLGEVEDEVHVATPVLAGEIPEDVRDEAPSEDEVDGASLVSGVDLSDVAEEEILEMEFPPGGVHVSLSSLDTVNVEALFRRRGCLMKSVPVTVPFGVAVGSAGVKNEWACTHSQVKSLGSPFFFDVNNKEKGLGSDGEMEWLVKDMKRRVEALRARWRKHWNMISQIGRRVVLQNGRAVKANPGDFANEWSKLWRSLSEF